VWYGGLASSSSPFSERTLVCGFTPPECHIWKKRVELVFLLFSIFLLRFKSAAVVQKRVSDIAREKQHADVNALG
jgi:hypothetical protein